jgi:LacI family transcriptional regulator
MTAPTKKVTLDDLSGRLQLSKFSISRALGGKKGVSDSTRELVLNAARELGYRHSGLQPVATASKALVHLIIPRNDVIDNPSWIEAISGAEAEARRMGWTLVTALAEEDYAAADGSAGVSGILLAGRRSRGLLETYAALDLPVVLIGYPNPGEHLDTVHVADWEGGVLIGRHLKELGHKRVAYITDAAADLGRRERCRGCRDALGEDGVVVEVLYDPEREREPGTLYRRLKELGQLPTAIVCASETVCMAALIALSEAGVRIPDDMSLVGSQSSPRPAQPGFNVTAIRNPNYRVGAMAADLLRQRMSAGNDWVPRRVALCPELIPSTTTTRVRNA